MMCIPRSILLDQDIKGSAYYSRAASSECPSPITAISAAPRATRSLPELHAGQGLRET
jgi:hypothetical protein